ncbi:MAG: exodeoxyribonuclease VII small subunit [Lachnospiraceae bacterium]|nr:exodeoxyribonuclease VII small subunit [Lachnospiraceae bacterium]
MADNQKNEKTDADRPGPDMPEASEELSVEEGFKRLDGLLARLEDRELPLEEAFALYQQGLQLVQQCSEKIDTVEKKILVLNGDGGFDDF